MSATSTGLNAAFARGAQGYEVIDQLRTLTNPILVDLNGVLINNREPFAANPDASEALRRLQAMGNVVIVSTESQWERAHQQLTEFGLWNDDVTLMTLGSWLFMADPMNVYTSFSSVVPNVDPDDAIAKADALRAEFVTIRESAGVRVSVDDLSSPPAGKRVAPLFGNRKDIPLIDDHQMATTGNPGIRGIQVEAWDPDPEHTARRPGLRLREAVDAVAIHFKSIGISATGSSPHTLS